jgi:hypothetical protein
VPNLSKKCKFLKFPVLKTLIILNVAFIDCILISAWLYLRNEVIFVRPVACKPFD